jgi:hypothetical protein
MARREGWALRFHEGAAQRMTTVSRNDAEGPSESLACWLDEEMAELSLLLSGWQAAQMERLAHSRGLTLGQLIRLLIRDYLADRARPSPVSKRPAGNQETLWGLRFRSQDASLSEGGGQ